MRAVSSGIPLHMSRGNPGQRQKVKGDTIMQHSNSIKVMTAAAVFAGLTALGAGAGIASADHGGDDCRIPRQRRSACPLRRPLFDRHFFDPLLRCHFFDRRHFGHAVPRRQHHDGDGVLPQRVAGGAPRTRRTPAGRCQARQGRSRRSSRSQAPTVALTTTVAVKPLADNPFAQSDVQWSASLELNMRAIAMARTIESPRPAPSGFLSAAPSARTCRRSGRGPRR